MKINLKNEKGFAIALALLLMLVMALMGTTLVVVASSDQKANAQKDINQQVFYAAETGITEAKKWLANNSASLSLGNNPNGRLSFCKTYHFPNLNQSTIRAINNYVKRKTLDQLISGNADEKKRFKEYSYEYFITRTPDQNGNTTSLKTKTVSSSSGTDISENNSYSSNSTTQAGFYTIFSCGKKNNDDTIVPIEAVVTVGG